jgi:hypothetical protein
MGLMQLFGKSAPTLLRLPAGSFTVDCGGNVVVGTLPISFPPDLIQEIAQQVLATFRGAAEAQLPLSEFIINFASLKITARELRGGAIVFLAPKVSFTRDQHC